MLTIGLTGQTGAGKGMFCDALKEYDGVYCLDTDKIAREVVGKGQPALDELAEYFGNEILQDDGTLNRRKLASIAFCDEEKHSKLNEITHFYIKQKTLERLNLAKKMQASAAIIDAPLLFESRLDKICDFTVGVIADKQTRLKRIMFRDGIDEKNAKIRIEAQPDDEFFRKSCTYILENDSTSEEFCKKVLEFAAQHNILQE